MSEGWMVDPVSHEPVPAIPGETQRPMSTASHWLIERDEAGVPVRMRFVFCDDSACCPELPESVR